MAKAIDRKRIAVYAHWQGLAAPALMGALRATPVRGQKVFSFAYARGWLAPAPAQVLDPALRLDTGPQHLAEEKSTFGWFLGSAPDRRGRLLLRRREADPARREGRRAEPWLESDHLLGVFDGHRMGGLRFKRRPDGPFLNDNRARAAPPWTSLREREHASRQLERLDAAGDPDYLKWLLLLLAPGASLGGARPKASVANGQGRLWMATFPSGQDTHDVGAWEAVVNALAQRAGLTVARGQAQRFGSRHRTYLSARFDRTATHERVHFASAMTLLGYRDGPDHQDGASYLELAAFLMQQGAHVAADLAELWRRIVFNICVANTDDHLRNHGFLLTAHGWRLSPAYDLNPVPHGRGLTLNVSETENALDLPLALEMAPFFRLGLPQAEGIMGEVVAAVRGWRAVAGRYQLSREEQELMANAFRAADR